MLVLLECCKVRKMCIRVRCASLRTLFAFIVSGHQEGIKADIHNVGEAVRATIKEIGDTIDQIKARVIGSF